MLTSYKFIKEPTNRWYINLPDWQGMHADLEMVDGADIMLDYVGQGAREVELQLAEEPFENATPLQLIEDYRDHVGGGIYLLGRYNDEELNQKMWLCGVTEFVFGKLPEVIYFKKVETNKQ
jgi:hypothetical protein